MKVIEKRTGTAKTYDKFMGKLNAMMENFGMSENRVVFNEVHAYHVYEDPTRPEIKIHSFLVNLKNYPLNMVNDAKHNCRTEGLKLKKTHIQLKEKVKSNETHLSLNHNGISVSTDGQVSQRGGVVTVDGEVFIRNGGHSNRIFQELAVEESLPRNQWIKVEVVEGKLSKAQSVEFSIGRNTGEPLKRQSALNLSGKTKWVQDILDTTPFGHRVAYQQGDEDTLHPIRFAQIVQLMDMCNLNKYSADTCPTESQLHPNKLLIAYEKDIDAFKVMSNVLVDVLTLHDGITEIMIESLKQKLGNDFHEALLPLPKNATTEHKANRDNKLWKRCRIIGNTKRKGTFNSPYTGKVWDASINESVLAPLMSSLRVFQQARVNKVSWRGGLGVTNILMVYRQVVPSIVEMIIKNQDITAPEQVAENEALWSAIYAKVDASFARINK